MPDCSMGDLKDRLGDMEKWARNMESYYDVQAIPAAPKGSAAQGQGLANLDRRRGQCRKQMHSIFALAQM